MRYIYIYKWVNENVYIINIVMCPSFCIMHDGESSRVVVCGDERRRR